MTPRPGNAIPVLIVDDEPIARNTLRLLLGRHPEVEVAGECSGAEAPAIIRGLRPQIVFLDVQMPELDGFEVLAEVGPENIPAIVFVTAYDQHALRAFEVHAVDYLLKPFDDARFELALQRALISLRGRAAPECAERLLRLLESGAYEERKPYLRRFAIRSGDRVALVRASEVDWIEAADYYACLHAGKVSHLLRESMAELERRLDPQLFFRIHRSAIVNLERVRELQLAAKGEYAVLLEDGTELRISRKRWEALQERLQR